jgi:hypothetical protein
MGERKIQLEEKDVYSFIASLQRINGNGEFCVRFKVIAGDVYEAQAILEEWLKIPERTGYKYQYCNGITRDASDRVIVEKE